MANEYVSLKSVFHILDLVIPDKTIKRPGKAIRRRLKELPTADVEKVVRCKNCKHFITDTFKRTVCNRTFTMFEMNENDFCSYGERKEGAEE